ncbi:hypothetical protein B0T26DRAFT_751720 [Lasiosphaeria miniovina]|uniref:Uncharacterized protein n=1 Tax=Lasiosphaeria miniovina TaxID=1954250 RepID=A0AA40AKU6_9PEZI|nr:uncharacterized protein B0T26DRAFT_751720 [Lasiosphaeria miniovina]KAK0717688.1 hypothetical protein B0T26DRAFT_751720 [Lasiosphaeria miniovina]
MEKCDDANPKPQTKKPYEILYLLDYLPKASHPAGTPEDVDAYLQNLVAETFYYDFYHSSDAFRKSYVDSHGRQLPYVIPFVQRRWAKGAAVTPSQNQEARRKLGVYSTWLHETLIAAREAEARALLPPILGALDIVVPVGDVPYNSRITGRVGYLPVVVDVMAAPGKDSGLLDGAEQIMAKSERPTVVATGS